MTRIRAPLKHELPTHIESANDDSTSAGNPRYDLVVLNGGGTIFGFADNVHPQVVRGAGDSGRGTGNDDDLVPCLGESPTEQLVVDLLEHRVRVGNPVDDKRLDSPEQRHAAA